MPVRFPTLGIEEVSIWDAGPVTTSTPQPGWTGAAPVVVVGAGISGLATAWRLHVALRDRKGAPPLVVLEQRPRTGGVLRRGLLGPASDPASGLEVDLGAEALLARRPEALDLIEELGLGAERVHPAVTRAAVASRGALHPLPSGTVMGVPSDPQALAGLLTPEEVERVAAERERSFPPVTGSDVAVAEWVGQRVGAAVVDRLVEPLLGGVYAGSAARLSLRATVPALWPAARSGAGLLDAVATHVAGSATSQGQAPVFAGLRGGVTRLAEELRTRLVAGGVAVRTRACVQHLESSRDGGWRVVLGPEGRGEVLEARAVVLAVPAPAAARLLADVVPDAAAALGSVPVASMALVSALLDDGALDGLAGGAVSGVLVPPVEGRTVKAMTFSSRKWNWVREQAGGRDVLRLSVGRAGDVSDLQRPDDELARLALADAAALLDRPLTARAVDVTRWGGALPQYGVGHLDLVAGVLAEVAGRPGLAVAGSAYGGVGVPACIATADAAAAGVLEHLG